MTYGTTTLKAGKVKGFSIEGYFADKLERPNEPVKQSAEIEAEQLLSKLKDLFKNE